VEAQIRALEAARGGAPVPPSELKALADVLERLDRLEQSRPASAAAQPERSLDEVRAEFARRLLNLYGPGGTRAREGDAAGDGMPIEPR